MNTRTLLLELIKQPGDKFNDKQELNFLREWLNQMVHREEYELAAVIQRRIDTLVQNIDIRPD
jgi:protein-arginine kinase activator protein McsA